EDEFRGDPRVRTPDDDGEGSLPFRLCPEVLRRASGVEEFPFNEPLIALEQLLENRFRLRPPGRAGCPQRRGVDHTGHPYPTACPRGSLNELTPGRMVGMLHSQILPGQMFNSVYRQIQNAAVRLGKLMLLRVIRPIAAASRCPSPQPVETAELCSGSV